MKKHFYRSTKNKMFGGVCGGIAEYFNIDPGIVRVIFVILALPGGFPGVIPYLAIWLFVPARPASA